MTFDSAKATQVAQESSTIALDYKVLGDPVPGVQKALFLPNALSDAPVPVVPAGAEVVAFDTNIAIKMADEGGRFGMPADGQGSYGASRRFFIKTFATGATVAASYVVFGDPIFGFIKAAFVVKGDGAPPAPILPVPPVSTTPAPTSIRSLFQQVTGRNYGYTSVGETELAALRQAPYTPYGNSGPVSKDTSGTGAQTDIGMIDGYSVIALAQEDTRSKVYAQVISDATESAPVFLKKSDGNFPTFTEMVGLGSAYGTYGNLTQQPDNSKYGWNVEVQHQCHYHFLAFLDAYARNDTARMDVLISRMKGLVVYTHLNQPASRFGAKNIYNVYGLDIRGAAWGMMSLGWCVAAMQLRGLNASNDHNFAEMAASVEWNGQYLAETFITGTPVWDNSTAVPYYDLPNGIFKNDLGFVGCRNNYGNNYPATQSTIAQIGGFQFSFFSQVAQTIYGMAKRGYLPISSAATENWRKVAVHVSKLITALGGEMNTTTGIDFRRGMHNFTLPAGTPGDFNGNAIVGSFFTSYKQMMDVWTAANGALPTVESPPLIRYHDSNKLVGGPSDGFLANYMPALAGAVDLQADGEPVGDALGAWLRLESSDCWVTGRMTTARQFAYTPRGRYIDAAPSPTPPATGAVPISGTGVTFFAAVRAVAVNTYCQATSFGVPKDAYDVAVAAGYRERGSGAAILDAWSGGVIRQADGQWFIGGGGHYDGGFNGIIQLNQATGAFSIALMPTLFSDAQYTAIRTSWSRSPLGYLETKNGVFPNEADPTTLNTPNTALAPDGNPYYPTVIGPTIAGNNALNKTKAAHTYGGFAVHGQKVFVQVFKRYDLDAQTGDYIETVSPTGVNSGGTISTDGTRGYYVNTSAGSFAAVQHDMVANTTVIEHMDYPYSPGQGANINFDSQTYIFVEDNKLIALKLSSDGSPAYVPPLAWSISLPLVSPSRSNNTVNFTSSLVSPTAWSADDMANCQLNTQAYDDINKILYIPAKDWSFFLTFNWKTKACGKVVMANTGPIRKANAAYGRFHFYRNEQVFGLINEFTAKPYFFRFARAR